MQEDSSNTLNYLEQDTNEPAIEEPEKVRFLEGICGKCLGSNFVHTVRDGVLGMAYRFEGADSVGKPIKRLLGCNHGSKQAY